MKKQLLTAGECATLILAVVRGHGENGCPNAVIQKAVDWAENARLESHLLELVLEKQLVMRWENKEWVYGPYEDCTN